MFWGLTPCLNIYDELQVTEGELNVLIIGGSDLRHVIKTLSKRRLYKNVKINFFLMEAIPELVAKQMLLLNLTLRPMKDLGFVQKTRIFMELFGNTLVRPVTAKYLVGCAEELIKMITNAEYLKRTMPMVSLDLKYKERDYIENVFKFWTSTDHFDISDCWDRRLRKFLGARYDSRKGSFDWDLHMRLHYLGGNMVGSQEYQSFRSSGVAFTWLESEVSKPNRSTVTGVIPNGDNFAHYGYLGEMQTGPFVAYGLECEDAEFTKKQNNTNKYRSTDITERNLRQYFYELEFNQDYEHQTTSDFTLGACASQLSDLKVVDTSNVPSSNHLNHSELINLDNVNITFLSENALNMMQHKDKYSKLFNLVYYSGSYLRYLSKDLLQHVAAPGCLLLVENQKFVLSYRKKELEEHLKNILEKIEGLDVSSNKFDVESDVYFRFRVK